MSVAVHRYDRTDTTSDVGRSIRGAGADGNPEFGIVERRTPHSSAAPSPSVKIESEESGTKTSARHQQGASDDVGHLRRPSLS